MLQAENVRLTDERDSYRATLEQIADMQCECTGYYRCGPCVGEIVRTAELALEVAP